MRPLPLALAAVLIASPLVSRADSSASAPSADVVQLAPFDVQENTDQSYGALNSNSITSFNAQLSHLPVSADIFDQSFMNDVGAISVEDMVQAYSAGAGFGSNDGASGAYLNQPGDPAPSGSYLRLEGLITSTIQRDSLLLVGRPGNPGSTAANYTSDFDVERVEVIDGPQALLYNGGGPGGVINVVSKQAELGGPSFATFSLRTDQYGTKHFQADYGASTQHVAVRVALLNATDDTRRIDIGNKTEGAYVQFAASAGNTLFRVNVEQTTNWQVNSAYDGITLTSTSADPLYKYNGYSLTYLLASGQAGAVLDGNLNWSNEGSFMGDWSANTVVDEFALFTAESKWTSWLSSQVSVGYSKFDEGQIMGTQSMDLYTPDASSNPLPGNWTATVGGSYPFEEDFHVYQSKALRAALLASNELFDGRGRSQTSLGGDYIGTPGSILPYDYYEADSNWNLVITPGATNLGRTVIAKQPWTVNNGPVQYPLFLPGASRITYDGVNYVRMLENPFSTALVSPSNPMGEEIPGGASDSYADTINDGVYAINYTSWLDGKLDTLAGIRLERSFQSNDTGTAFEAEEINSFNFNVGADYHVNSWLAPYFSVSNQHDLAGDATNPLGELVPPGRALGEEVGFKLGDPAGLISGSIAAYHTDAVNQTYDTSSTLALEINPSGLNGRYGDASEDYDANVTANGLNVTLTSSPTPNWRMRLSGSIMQGKYQNTVSFPQVYNDQFYENASGDVTYADGTVVYVPATYNSKELTVSSTTAGAVPLTVALMSNPSSSYYANPNLISGAISSSSDVAKVLETTSSTHGAILTGATGLPISDLQLIGADIPGLSVPGTIVVAPQGASTTGYPQLSVNLTSVYQFASGWLKGFEIGGTAFAQWKDGSYYYFPNGITVANATQSLFYLPTNSRFDLIAGFSHKFKRVTFSTQLNVYNIFNHYDVVIFPDSVTGWTQPSELNASFNQQPRDYVWTNRISF